MKKLLLLLGLLLSSSLLHSEVVIFLVDESGSMRKSDPQELTVRSISLYAQIYNLLNPEIPLKLGIIGFSDSARVILNPILLSQVKLDTVVLKIRRDGKYTDIRSALEKGLQLVGDEKDVSFIMLTDGKVDVPDSIKMTEYFSQLDSLIAEYSLKYYAIHAVGLSENVDVDFLKRIATATGGEYHIVLQAQELVNIFSRLVSVSTGTLTKPLILKVQETPESTELRFFIPSATPRFVVAIVKPSKRTKFSLAIFDPDGKLVECNERADCSITETQGVIIIRKNNPIRGQWTILLQGTDKKLERIRSFLYLQAVNMEIKSPIPKRGYPYNDSLLFDVALSKKDPSQKINFERFKVKVTIVSPFGDSYTFDLKRKHFYRYQGYTRKLEYVGLYTATVELIDSISETRLLKQLSFYAAPVPDLIVSFLNGGVVGSEVKMIIQLEKEIPTQAETLELKNADLKVALFEKENLVEVKDIEHIKNFETKGLDTIKFKMPSKLGHYILKISSEMNIYYKEPASKMKSGTYMRTKVFNILNGFKLVKIKKPGFLFFGNLFRKGVSHKILVGSLFSDTVTLKIEKGEVESKKLVGKEKITFDTIYYKVPPYSVTTIPVNIPPLPFGSYKTRINMIVLPFNAPLVVVYKFRNTSPITLLTFLMALLFLLALVVVSYKYITRPKLRGALKIGNMPEYNLKSYGKSEVVLGVYGDIKLGSIAEGVKERHAKIVATKDGDTIFPLEGDVYVNGELVDDAFGQVLTDGDRISLGNRNDIVYILPSWEKLGD